jgi:YidC/Oxa1 family membrane protein insertase
MQNTKNNNKNIILASIISLAFLLLWQHFYEVPRQKKLANLQGKEKDKLEILEKQEKNNEELSKPTLIKEQEAFIPTELALSASPKRLNFENKKIKGSINPIGLKIDNLALKDYKTENNPTILLSPSETKDAYFIQLGFNSSDETIKMPNNKTVWSLEKRKDNLFNAKWKNEQGVTFHVLFELDENYMFQVSSSVINSENKEIPISAFVRILRTEPKNPEATLISHEGFVYNFGRKFNELKYDKVKDKKRLNYNGEKELFWAGFTDKYWLTSFFYNNTICIEKKCNFASSDVSLNHFKENGLDRYQVDFIIEEVKLKPKETFTTPFKIFAGAKELKLLDKYADDGFEFNGKNYKFSNFDKTVDFGIFYFLTKPIFLLITFLNSFLHNFGFAIILLTVIIKLLLFPIATKSYISMGNMKLLAPEIKNIRENVKDKMEQNRKIMELYKEKQVNPLSGCLPIMLQIPVFFALYKVLYISIEMRGAEFIWWIKDLSVKDPTSIFNLFGLLPFDVPSFLQIGILPILMGATTFLQQSLSPRSNDPTQDMIVKTMPFLLIFIFASFPAGIVLYWIVNNILSVSQQLYIEKVILKKTKKKR